jgi:hypothetical protein
MRMSVTITAAISTWRTAEIWSHGIDIAEQGTSGLGSVFVAEDDARARIQKLLVTGDNRLKQGVAAEKVKATYEQALEVARQAGLEESVCPLVELRLADLERLARESPRSEPPAA